MTVRFQHSLVIGGTGMLAGATRRVAAHSAAITLVARDTAPMAALAGATAMNAIGVDYTEVDTLQAALRSARDVHGEFDLAVLWIHSTGADALDALAERFGEQQAVLRVVHVVGSRGRSTPVPRLAEVEGVVYQRVLLGHVDEGGSRRWLTHDEISEGTWLAIASDERETVVGQLG